MTNAEGDKFHDTLMAWGAWHNGYRRSSLGYGRTIYERMIAGLRGTTCGKCIGRKMVRDVVSDDWVQCPVCKGKGKVNVAARGKINPAMIPSTRPPGLVVDDEPHQFVAIDNALRKLTIRHRIVIIARYVDYPRRTDGDKRARHVNLWLDRIGERQVSKQRIEQMLFDAKAAIRAEVVDKR